ncbi:MAG: hypothetical protein JO076_10280 [Verrucomicrobia bacterium]|nr:hypothetical protein [Verrucomicrobiota bacterium]
MALIETITLATAANLISKSYPALASAASKWVLSKLKSGDGRVEVETPIKIAFDADDLRTVETSLRHKGSIGVGQDEPPRVQDVERLKVVLAFQALSRAHARLEPLVPQAKARYLKAKRLRIAGSVLALASNVTVLGTLGLQDKTATTAAAIVALLVSALKLFEDYFVAGITGDKPQRLLELLVQTNQMQLEMTELLHKFRTLTTEGAPFASYPLSDADRLVAEAAKAIPEMDLVTG